MLTIDSMNSIVYDEVLDISCLIVLNLLVFINLRSVIYNKKGIYTNYCVLWLFITAFSLYYRPLDGDFWSSLNDFIGQGNLYSEHMETIYLWLKDLLDSNYLLWRFIVWGLAAVWLVLIFKKLDIHPAIATVCFLVFGLLNSFYYMRNSLGFGILYFSIAYYTINSRINVRSRFFVLLFLSIISYFFHKSMPLYILCSYIALFLNFNKKILFSLLLLFPILYFLLNELSVAILSAGFWQNDSGLSYLNVENDVYVNWKGMLELIIHYVPFIYIIYCFFRYDIKSDDREFYARRSFFIIFFLLAYLSFLFYGQGSKHLHLRFWNTAMYPFSIFIALYYKKYAPSKSCTIFGVLVGGSILIPYLISILR